MGEKTPDTEESGIERRNVLKGLGFGTVGAVGAGAFAGNTVAQDGEGEDGEGQDGEEQDGEEQDGEEQDEEPSPGDFGRMCECAEIIDFAMLVPPGEEADHQNRSDSFADEPDGGMDLLFQLDTPGTSQSDQHTIAYEVALVRQPEEGNPRVATKSVEEGRTRCFAGTVRTTPGGETQRREEFSTSGLLGDTSPTAYWVVLTVADYSQLPNALPVDAGVIPVNIT